MNTIDRPSVCPVMRSAPPPYFARFDPILRAWLVIKRADESKRAQFPLRGDAEEYADLRGKHDFERSSSRVKTIPPSAMVVAPSEP